MSVRRVMAGAALALALVASGCTSDSGSGGSEGAAASDAPATLEAHGGTGQIWLLDEPNATYELVGADGEVVDTQLLGAGGEVELVAERTADDEGALVLRYVEPGEGYVVRRTDGTEQSEPITVTSKDQHPDQALYDDQELVAGYQYIETRDGTKLAANVTLPGPIEDGPYPTVIEYSGYDPASPTASLVTISKQLAAQLGFATVGVNIRGSGCSGGSMQLWEDAQAIDGYDVVETVAAQDWVAGGKVGMVGISYPASAMLYTAATQPPSLAAIAPMAGYDDGFRALLWPGGIQNEGFAKKWIQERYDQAQNPSPAEWVNTQIDDAGDETCAENLRMRGQNVDLAALIDDLPYFPTVNGLGDSFAPETFVDQIEVPTYLVASWQDEQVGGHAPTFIPQFSENEQAWFTLINGYHTEGLAEPSILQGWLEFLQLFVADEVPDTTGLAALYPAVAGEIIKDGEAAAQMPIPAENYDGLTYDEALATWDERPRVRVIFDEGGAASVPPGTPTGAFEAGFDAYPVADTEPTRWFLGPDGTLTPDEPTAADDAAGTIDAYTSDPSARPAVSLAEGEDSWERLPTYDWAQPVDGKALVYTSPALEEDTVMVGSASADLWVRSSEADTDLQVTISEVRPDGQEVNVQSGWLRASKRALDEERSTELQPLITQLEEDAEPLPEGEFVPVRVEVYPFGHAFRAGSQVRVTISAPGGDRPVWSFVQLDGTQDNEIARSEGRPSSIVLPIVPGVDVPTGSPACPSLRGNPCRPVEPFTNQTNEG